MRGIATCAPREQSTAKCTCASGAGAVATPATGRQRPGPGAPPSRFPLCGPAPRGVPARHLHSPRPLPPAAAAPAPRLALLASLPAGREPAQGQASLVPALVPALLLRCPVAAMLQQEAPLAPRPAQAPQPCTLQQVAGVCAQCAIRGRGRRWAPTQVHKRSLAQQLSGPNCGPSRSAVALKQPAAYFGTGWAGPPRRIGSCSSCIKKEGGRRQPQGARSVPTRTRRDRREEGSTGNPGPRHQSLFNQAV